MTNPDKVAVSRATLGRLASRVARCYQLAALAAGERADGGGIPVLIDELDAVAREVVQLVGGCEMDQQIG